ncbi:sulfotransferase family 2 domain-containing protein [Parabacteroides gordonii]|uniref:sulfotransferase family 2 domain-containing protein n=1 Tax=Parabacteroides gordonii TaxID=574930 RepID=UPI000EEC8102|nr:sulfotransferase family 2 domain-containing protein [Parabacteroides gordonii]RGP16797.1 hypothetical protein DXB27_08740 [Parabacteroides gordonii]
MIVDNKRKVIYLHNPKCGGTFLRDIYIEKYGKSDATKWWKTYDPQYGTDLGHITYLDLYRFIPDWKDYRIVMMVRNPYSRFYSAVKEVKLHLIASVKLSFIEIPCARLDKEGMESRIRNTFFRSICPWTYTHTLVKLFTVSPEECCKQILSFKHSKQDLFIRSKKIPWLNPQSYFWGKDVEIFYYESESDWGKLLDIFGLSEYQVRLSIAKAYNIPDNMYEMIEKLYPEDTELFRKYRY